MVAVGVDFASQPKRAGDSIGTATRGSPCSRGRRGSLRSATRASVGCRSASSITSPCRVSPPAPAVPGAVPGRPVRRRQDALVRSLATAVGRVCALVDCGGREDAAALQGQAGREQDLETGRRLLDGRTDWRWRPSGCGTGLPEVGDFALAVKSDAFLVRTMSDALSAVGAGKPGGRRGPGGERGAGGAGRLA